MLFILNWLTFALDAAYIMHIGLYSYKYAQVLFFYIWTDIRSKTEIRKVFPFSEKRVYPTVSESDQKTRKLSVLEAISLYRLFLLKFVPKSNQSNILSLYI